MKYVCVTLSGTRVEILLKEIGKTRPQYSVGLKVGDWTTHWAEPKGSRTIDQALLEVVLLLKGLEPSSEEELKKTLAGLWKTRAGLGGAK